MSRYTDLTAWYEPAGGIDYVTTRAIEWEIGRKGSDLLVAVKPGTRFQLSVPRPLRWLVDPHDTRLLKAACLHDDLLSRGWDRTTCAAVFAEALRADGVSRLKRAAMFCAVALYRWD